MPGIHRSTPLTSVALTAAIVIAFVYVGEASRAQAQAPLANGPAAFGGDTRARPVVTAVLEVPIARNELRLRALPEGITTYESIAPIEALSEADGYDGVEWAFGDHSPNPSWSFDGTKIAFHDGVCVSIIDSNGELVDRIDPYGNNNGCFSPRWSHDGMRIVASTQYYEPPPRLYNLKPRTYQDLGDDFDGVVGSGIWSLSFSPNDQFLIGRIATAGAWVFPLDGSGASKALVTDKRFEEGGYFPSFSPDGKRVVRVLPGYRRDRLEISAWSSDLQQVKVTDSEDDRFTVPAVLASDTIVVESAQEIVELEWSPDGQTLAVIMAPGTWLNGDHCLYPIGELVLVDVPSGRVQHTDVRGRNPEWSPDGQYIAFDRPYEGIWLMPISGETSPQQLHVRGVEPRWSPQGDKIFILNPEKAGGEILTLGTESA